MIYWVTRLGSPTSVPVFEDCLKSECGFSSYPSLPLQGLPLSQYAFGLRHLPASVSVYKNIVADAKWTVEKVFAQFLPLDPMEKIVLGGWRRQWQQQIDPRAWFITREVPLAELSEEYWQLMLAGDCIIDVSQGTLRFPTVCWVLPPIPADSLLATSLITACLTIFQSVLCFQLWSPAPIPPRQISWFTDPAWSLMTTGLIKSELNWTPM